MVSSIKKKRKIEFCLFFVMFILEMLIIIELFYFFFKEVIFGSIVFNSLRIFYEL